MTQRVILPLLLLVALIACLLAYQRSNAVNPRASTSVPVGDVPVVFRSNGGLLEVATLTYTQQFKRTEAGTLFGLEIPGCPTVATVTRVKRGELQPISSFRYSSTWTTQLGVAHNLAGHE